MFTSVILVTSSSLWDSLYGITSDDVDVAYVHCWPNEPLDLIIDIQWLKNEMSTSLLKRALVSFLYSQVSITASFSLYCRALNFMHHD